MDGYKLETTDHDNGVKLLDNSRDCPFHDVHFTLVCPVFRRCCFVNLTAHVLYLIECHLG